MTQPIPTTQQVSGRTLSDEAKWHWAEGMKFAIEGIKAVPIINGASAVSILTFVGNTNAKSNSLVLAMVFFAIGAASAIPTLLFSYITQLHYGNHELAASTNQTDDHYKKATKYHLFIYIGVIGGFIFFIVGVVFAAFGLWTHT